MAETRWDRLINTLTEACIEARLHTTRDTLGKRGDVITVQAGQSLITVHDTVWHKNHDVWTGWEVIVEGPDSIIIRTWPKTKKRGDVRRHVEEALATVAA